MAIQQIESNETNGSIGIAKSINKGAKGMILDVVQSQQYQKPIPSTVRELAANAVDSQSEKEKALLILNGTAKSEDYFIHRDGDLYADSNWDPSYYKIKHLSDKKEIELIYKEGEDLGRVDKFIVRDYGVGIGMRRLQGILSIGYSTKRNRKDALGAFGLGAKVGLSTGAEFYTMITVYNGIKYRIKIFKKKFNSLIGKLNLETGTKNIPYEFLDDDGKVIGIIYGEKCDELNYTQIEIPCLKHHKYEFDTAVKTQLLFFDNVRYYHEDIDNDRDEIDFKANIKYNSDNIIIAEDVPYSKPYIIIVNGNQSVGVCYGHIDFKELEIEDLSGAVGIKCNIRQIYEDEDGETVEINPGVDVIASREAVQWNAATRTYIKSKFAAAKLEATTLVEAELQSDDFLQWFDACKTMKSFVKTDTILSTLSSIVNVSELTPTYANTDIRYRSLISQMFSEFEVRVYSKYRDKDDKKFKTNKDIIDHSSAINIQSLYTTNAWEANRERDIFLCDQHDGKYAVMRPLTLNQIEEDITKQKGSLFYEYTWDKKGKKNKPMGPKEFLKYRLTQQRQMIKLIKTSVEHKPLKNVVIPSNYLKTLEEIEKGERDEQGDVIEHILTPAERRKLEKRIVCNQIGYNGGLNKIEPKVIDIQENEGEIYYGTQLDHSKLEYAKDIACGVAYKKNQFNDDFNIIQASQPNQRYFKNHLHINSFFGRTELMFKNGIPNGLKFMVSNIIVNWNTARVILNKWGDLSFFENFDMFNSEMTELYRELRNYIKEYYTYTNPRVTTPSNEHHAGFCSFLDAIETFQHYLEENIDNDEGIAEKAIELADIAKAPDMVNIKSALVVDTEILNKFDTLLAYANPMKSLLNYIDVLTIPGKEIPTELGIHITEFIKQKQK